MIKLLKFFTPILWIIVSLLLVNLFLEMMTQANTIANIVGFLGILLIVYLTYVSKLGTYLFK